MIHPVEEATIFLLEIQARHMDGKVREKAKELEQKVRDSVADRLPPTEEIVPA